MASLKVAPAASRLFRDGNPLPKRGRVASALAFLQQRLEAAGFPSELGALGQDFRVQGRREGLELGVCTDIQTSTISAAVPLALKGGWSTFLS